MYRKITSLFLVGVLCLFYTGCKEENPVIIQEEKPSAVVMGKASASSGFDSEAFIPLPNAVISISVMNESADLITQVEEVTSDNNGRFSLDINIEEEKKYFLTAQKDDKKLISFISSKLNNGLTYYTQPLNIETTIEALVYLEILKNNYSNVSYADVADYINTSLGKSLNARRDLIASTAKVISKKVEMRNAFIISEAIGATPEDIVRIVNVRKSAKEVFERDLYFASSAYHIRSASASYIESMIAAFVNTGISSEKCLKIVELMHQSLLKESVTMEPEVGFGLVKNSAFLYSQVLQYALLEKFTELGIQQNDLSALQAAGDILEISVQNSESKSELYSAFAVYQASVIIVLNRIIGVHAGIISGFDYTVKSFKEDYMAVISSASNGSVLIDAYLNFYTELKNETDLFIQSNIDSQIAKAAEIIVLLNIHF